MARVLTRCCGLSGFLVLSASLLLAAPKAAAQTKVSDDALRDRIEHRLQTDPSVRKYDVRVKVDDGDVKLDGTVATEQQKQDAERIAKMAGVDDVDNDIDVDKDADLVLATRAAKGLSRSGEALKDSWIEHKVEWFFVGESLLDGSKIDVDSKDHVVTLDGKVRSEAARARALELATYVDGVVKVVDKLVVDND
jgi:osmotically-inducible protein OsmY